MTGEIINFRKARKAKARADKEKRAEENRAKFGRTKAEKQKARAEGEIAVRRLDAHRRAEGGDEDEGESGA